MEREREREVHKSEIIIQKNPTDMISICGEEEEEVMRIGDKDDLCVCVFGMADLNENHV